jgi:hypothetical protein
VTLDVSDCKGLWYSQQLAGLQSKDKEADVDYYFVSQLPAIIIFNVTSF